MMAKNIDSYARLHRFWIMQQFVEALLKDECVSTSTKQWIGKL